MSLEIRPTVAVLVPPKPGGKPREVVVDLATIDEIIMAFCDAKTVLHGADAALAGCRALDERRVAEDTAEAVPPSPAKQEPLTDAERDLLANAAAEDDAQERAADPAPPGEWGAELAAAHPLRCGNPACEHPEGVHYMGGRADMITRHCLDEGCSCAAFSTPSAFAQALDDADGGEPVITAPADPGWRDERTGLMSGRAYDHLNRLSCGCTFAGPLTWPAGRKAHCDTHGAVITVASDPAAPDHATAWPATPFLPAEMLLAASEAPCKCGHPMRGDDGHEQPGGDDGQPGGCMVGSYGCRSWRPARARADGEPSLVVPLIVPGMVIPADGEARPFPALGAAS